MDIYEQIEQYAFGRLTGTDLAAFEARMKAEPDFAAMVKEELSMIRAIRLSAEVQAFRQQVNAVKNEHLIQTSQPSSRRFQISRKALSVAAGLVLLAVTVWLLMDRTQSVSPEQLFAAHFHPVSSMPEIKGGKTTIPGRDATLFYQNWTQTRQAFEQRQYDAALVGIASLERMPEGSDFADDLAYYKGLALLHLNRPTEAAAEFTRIQVGYPSEKPWYLALAQLKAGNIDQAKDILQTIANSRSPFETSAKEILKRLK